MALAGEHEVANGMEIIGTVLGRMMQLYSCDAKNCRVQRPLEGDHRLLYVGIAYR